MSLTFERKEAASGTPKSLVILVHGYGADGKDLIGLADPLAPHLPDTTFLSPNAPTRCTNNPMGYQWFPIPWLDGSSEVEAGIAMAAAAAAFNTYLDEMAEAEGITAQNTILLGFSQGTMMSLQVGLRRADPLAGIIGFSGRLLQPEALKSEIVSKPPVLLVHGDQDDVVPYESMALAEAGLKAAGVDVAVHTSPGTAHGIAPDGLTLALQSAMRWLA